MRMEASNNKTLVPTFDCCFHPMALAYASKSIPYRDLIAATVSEGATKQFKTVNEIVQIDQNYLILKGTQYKNGKPPAMMIETKKKTSATPIPTALTVTKPTEKKQRDNVVEKVTIEGSIEAKSSSGAETNPIRKGFLLKSTKTKRKKDNIGSVSNRTKIGFEKGGGKNKDGDTIPEYEIIERGEFDMTDHTIEGLKRPSTRPKLLIIRIKLPGIKSIDKSVELDVSEERLVLKSSQSDPIYNLCLKLSYPVMSEDGVAKFDKETYTLTVKIPVCRPDVITPWSTTHDDDKIITCTKDENEASTKKETREKINNERIISSPIIVKKEEYKDDLNESPVIVEKPPAYDHSRWLDTTNNFEEKHSIREEFACDQAIPAYNGITPIRKVETDVNIEIKKENDSYPTIVEDEESDESFQVVEHVNCKDNENNDTKSLLDNVEIKKSNDDITKQQLKKEEELIQDPSMYCNSNLVFELD